jgi:hypothetical protein
MDARKIVAIVLAVLLVLTFITSASAACAWVLWIRAAPADDGGRLVGSFSAWTTHGAATNAHGCDELIPRDDERRKAALDATGISLARGQMASLRWQCLPDTIDPRGPKGTAR